MAENKITKDEQIEEMAKDLCECYVDYGTDTIDVKATAEKLTIKGYRKASDVAREIFEEIEEVFRQHTDGGYYLNNAWIPEYLDPYTQDAVAKLKKKYTEGER